MLIEINAWRNVKDVRINLSLRNKAVRTTIARLPVIIHIIRYIRILIVANKFKKAVSKIRSFNDMIDLAFSFKSMGITIAPIQVREEIVELLKLVMSLKPKIILEIGTWHGGTLFLFTRIADPVATVISIDLPDGSLSHYKLSYPRSYHESNKLLYKSFATDNQKIILLKVDSQSPVTLSAIKIILNGRKADFLLIDGDHAYEAVKKDFEMYSKLVRQGGIIALHDIVPNQVGVYRLWCEIRNQFRHAALVKNWNEKWGGTGVLFT